jgi:hypothetical protein
MFIAKPSVAPASSLLNELARSGSFTDCYVLDVPRAVSQAQFVEAFYTTRLFKAERLVIRVLAQKPSTDQDAHDLAAGKKASFAVWQVTQQTPEQLLLTDQTGVTSSWLMVQASPNGSATTLYFGSAFAARLNPKTGKKEFSKAFHALLGLHAFYSRRLLQAAATKLMAQQE